MMGAVRRWVPLSLWIMLVILTVTIVASLLEVRRRYHDRDRDLARTVAAEFPVSWLDMPEPHRLIFDDIARRAEQIVSRNPAVAEIVVTMRSGQRSEQVLYPVSMLFSGPSPVDDSTHWHRMPLRAVRGVLGFLHIRFERTQQRWLDAFALLASLALTVLVVWVGLRLQRSARQVRRTMALLDQKQRELFRLQRLARVGQVSAGLLHELKKPMLNIREEVSVWDPERSAGRIMEQVQLFQSLLDEFELEGFVGSSNAPAEFVDPVVVVDKALRLVSYERGHVDVQLHLSEDLPFLWGVEHQLIQVFANLISNAYRAMHGDGTLTLRAHGILKRGVPLIRFHITDTGPGIPDHLRNSVFQPFFTTGESGQSTGLGLYIVSSLIAGMGGEIDFRSQPGQGTDFSVTLPAAVDPERSGPKQ